MNWFPCHLHDFGSLLDGLSKPSRVAEVCQEYGYTHAAITNHGSISTVPAHFRECKKRGIVPIAGCEFYVCDGPSADLDKENRARHHLCVLAPTQSAWKRLLRANAQANRNFYYRPRLSLEELAAFSGGEFVVFSGHVGSNLANVLFSEPKLAYRANTLDQARGLLHPEYASRADREIGRFQELFGRDNFFVEIQRIDIENLPATEVVSLVLREAAARTGTPCIATADSHYPTREDARDQRVLLCLAFHTTIRKVERSLANDEDVTLGGFFRSSNYHVPSPADLAGLHTPDELDNLRMIAERVESFSLSARPYLPRYGDDPDEQMRQLCRDGWKRHVVGKVPADRLSEYTDRVRMELKVLQEAGLSSYFLIVWDYVRYARHDLHALTGERGSGAGCLVSYLMDLITIDPVRFGLIFERFYNAGRNTPDKVSLPDFDCDFPKRVRERVVDYCRTRYGEARVAQMATFSRMQGRGALKDVLRVHERCTPDEANRITEYVPDESAIADELEQMRKDGDEPSIIRWALEDHPDKLKPWCSIEDGQLTGPLAREFAQAIRLEGTQRSMGRHPSGLVICSVDLEEVVPMVRDKSGNHLMVGVDMRDAEEMGIVKFDILGSHGLDKIEIAEQIVCTGDYDLD